MAYPLYGTAADNAAVRHTAYEQIYRMCSGAYRIVSENTDLTPTERAEAQRTGVTFPQNDPVWIIRFSCTAQPAGKDPNAAVDAAAPP